MLIPALTSNCCILQQILFVIVFVLFSKASSVYFVIGAYGWPDHSESDVSVTIHIANFNSRQMVTIYSAQDSINI